MDAFGLPLGAIIKIDAIAHAIGDPIADIYFDSVKIEVTLIFKSTGADFNNAANFTLVLIFFLSLRCGEKFSAAADMGPNVFRHNNKVVKQFVLWHSVQFIDLLNKLFER